MLGPHPDPRRKMAVLPQTKMENNFLIRICSILFFKSFSLYLYLTKFDLLLLGILIQWNTDRMAFLSNAMLIKCHSNWLAFLSNYLSIKWHSDPMQY